MAAIHSPCIQTQLVQMRRRHIRGGGATPPLSDADEPTDTPPQPVPTSNGLNTTTNDDNDNTSGIANETAPNGNGVNLGIDHMVSDRRSEERDAVTNGETSSSRFSNTAMTRLTMDGLDCSDEDES